MPSADTYFKPGNKASPGRPKREKEAEYLRLLTTQVTPQAWVRIIDKAMAQAEEGDAKAREWLSRYLLADPSEKQDSSLANLREIAEQGDPKNMTAEELHASIAEIEREVAEIEATESRVETKA